MAKAPQKIIRIAVMKGTYQDAVVDEIVERRPGQKVVRDCDWMEVVTDRPDIAVGTKWPFSSWEDYQATLKTKGGA